MPGNKLRGSKPTGPMCSPRRNACGASAPSPSRGDGLFSEQGHGIVVGVSCTKLLPPNPSWRSGGAHELGGAPAEKLNGMIIIRISENDFKMRFFWLLYFQHTWRIVFTARTRPAFRSPQSLRRPPDDVTALATALATLLVVMMTSPGGCTPAAPAALPREEGCRKANAFLCTPPPFQPGSSLHHHLRGPLAHPFL